MAAAEARRVLVEMAAAKLGTPADSSSSPTASSAPRSTATRRPSYAELIGGKYFNVQLDWNKQMGNALYAPGKAQPKKPNEHKIVGKPIKREDVAPKVFAQEDFCTDIKVPGMVHGRMIRPAVAGAVPVKVDESSIKDIPGAQVVCDKNGFLGVVADKEWDAIKAAEKLKVEWSKVEPPFPDQTALYDHIRKAPVRKSAGREARHGNVDEAFKTAAKVIEAEYEWPFQSHAAWDRPARWSRSRTARSHCWTGSQKSHFVQRRRRRAARRAARQCPRALDAGPRLLRPQRRRRLRAMDAAVLAKAVGKPVRAAIHARQGTGWDPKGPASIHRARAAIDAQGNVIAYEFISKGFSRVDVNTNGSKLVRHAGRPDPRRRAEVRRRLRRAGGVLRVRQQEDAAGRPSRRCSIARRRCARRICAIRSGRKSTSPANRSWTRWRRRSTRTRSSSGCKHIKDPRDIAADQGRGAEVRLGHAAVAAQGPDRQQGDRARHRLLAAQRHPGRGDRARSRSTARAARSGPSKFTVAHDCGQIINPDGLEKCIEGNIVQGISRTLWEEVKFDNKNVTSVDWHDLSDPRHHRDAGDRSTSC